MNRPALLASLAAALLGGALLFLYLRKFEREMSGGEPVELLMIVKAIERGKPVTEDALATRSVPFAYVEDRAVKAGERSKVLGLETSVSLSPQQTLMWTDLAVTTEDRDLSALVQPGKRAFTVQASSNDNRGSALIRPGDYVDVLATLSDAESGTPASVVLLQRVLVLAVGNETGGAGFDSAKSESGFAQRDKLLTLSLTLSETQLLTLAIERGRISVALRQPEDPGVQADIPDMKVSTLFDTRLRAGVQQAPTLPNRPVRLETVSVR